jgi:hypothetical protein
LGVERAVITGEGCKIGTFSADRVADLAATIEREWGTGRMTAGSAPSLVSEPSFLDYFGARERRTASPGTMAAWARAMATSDIRDLLPRVEVPTQAYYTGDLTNFAVEHSRYLAGEIPGAILVEAAGSSFYLPAQVERLNAWAEFIVGGPAALSNENKFPTLLFTDVVGSTKQAAQVGDVRWVRVVGNLNAYVAKRAELHGGRVVKQTGDGHLIAFDLPRDALRAACVIALGVHVFGVEASCGLQRVRSSCCPTVI